MNQIDIQNNKRICEIVENHFSLDKESITRFKDLINNREIDEVYSSIIGSDLRARRKVSEKDGLKIFMDKDEGWRFIKRFDLFCSIVNPTYEDFIKNSFTFKKNKYKLSKILYKIYSDKRNDIVEIIKNFNRYSYYKKIDYVYINKIEKGDNDEFKTSLDFLSNFIFNMRNSFLKKDNIEIVLSLNFADWFLCSTSESWTSCMSLESEYSDCYWSGLPGLIVDKNRCMIYITDGVKKEYNNIITDRFLFRAWGLLDENNELYIPMVYPNKTKDLFNLYDFFGIKEIGCCCSNFKTKHSIDFLYHKKGDSCFAYSDKSNISNEGDNYYITYSESGGFNYVSKYSEYISSGNIFYYDGGLSNLIDRGINLSEYEEDYCTCDECGERMCNNDSFTGPRDVILCEYCYNNLIVCCENCGATEFSETMDDYNWININDINYCSNCASQVSQICDICGDIELNEYTHSYIDFSNIERICCDKCFIEKIEVCKSCGESYRSNLMKNELCFNCKT
jgi:hypothetical protein